MAHEWRLLAQSAPRLGLDPDAVPNGWAGLGYFRPPVEPGKLEAMPSVRLPCFPCLANEDGWLRLQMQGAESWTVSDDRPWEMEEVGQVRLAQIVIHFPTALAFYVRLVHVAASQRMPAYIVEEAISAKDGGVIGQVPLAAVLVGHYGIMPERAKPTLRTATIGFSGKHGAWFGWGARMIQHFAVGMTLDESSLLADRRLRLTADDLAVLPAALLGFTITNVVQAKACAIVFAREVG
jgi:hypothetical protein